MTFTETEIKSQPADWQRAIALDTPVGRGVPRPDEHVLIVGCGTSAFVAQSMAWLRDSGGDATTDWAYASELPPSRSYDHLIAVTRSGTTSEVLQALRDSRFEGARRTVITASPEALDADLYDDLVDLSFAEERSVVQTRFPTALLTWWRARHGADLGRLPGEGDDALTAPLEVDADAFDHFVFLGRGWALGLAHEAALKMRECAQGWSESHPSLDYRHGPIAAADARTLVVDLGGTPDDLLDEIRATGASVRVPPYDPVARLVTCQRLAVHVATARGLDLDNPRNLSRSVILGS